MGGAVLLNYDGSLTFTPSADYFGTIDFTYTISDGSLSSQATVTVNILSVNDAPIGIADTVIAIEEGGAGNNTAGTNPSGNVLTNDTDADVGDVKIVTGVSAGIQSSAAGFVASTVNACTDQST